MEYLYFNHLNSVQQSVYKELMRPIMDAATQYELQTKATVKDVFAAEGAIYKDHPGIFWCPQTCSTLSRVNTGIVKTVKLEYNDLANNLNRRQHEFQNAVEDYLRQIRGKDLLTAELIINDKMVRDITYVHGNHDQTAYAALVEKKAVCAGYTRAFQLLMMKMGVICTYCSGNTFDKKSKSWGSHGWNIIQLGNDWYNVDVTWNDGYEELDKNIVDHNYFNCQDSKFGQLRKRDKECEFLPKCNGEMYSFENLKGICPELDLIYQEGVSIKKVVTNPRNLFEILLPIVKESPSNRSVRISCPVSDGKVCQNAITIFEDVIKCVGEGRWGYNLSTQNRDYNNGWYRLTMEFTVKK